MGRASAFFIYIYWVNLAARQSPLGSLGTMLPQESAVLPQEGAALGKVLPGPQSLPCALLFLGYSCLLSPLPESPQLGPGHLCAIDHKNTYQKIIFALGATTEGQGDRQECHVVMKTSQKLATGFVGMAIAPVQRVRLLRGVGEPIWSGSFLSYLLSC